MYSIDWGDLQVSERLAEGDVVSLVTQDIDPNFLEIRLELASHLTWWKAVEVYDNTNRMIQRVECQDDQKVSGPVRIDMRDIRTGGKIWLCKAKAFGIHMPIYEAAYLEHMKGKRLTFRWSAD